MTPDPHLAHIDTLTDDAQRAAAWLVYADSLRGQSQDARADAVAEFVRSGRRPILANNIGAWYWFCNGRVRPGVFTTVLNWAPNSEVRATDGAEKSTLPPALFDLVQPPILIATVYRARGDSRPPHVYGEFAHYTYPSRTEAESALIGAILHYQKLTLDHTTANSYHDR